MYRTHHLELPGGAIYTLDTKNTNTFVYFDTWQVHNGDFITVVANHDNSVKQISSSLDNWQLEQYVAKDPKKSDAFGGVVVNPGVDLSGIGSKVKAQTESKYYLRDGTSKNEANESDIDIVGKIDTYNYYRVRVYEYGSMEGNTHALQEGHINVPPLLLGDSSSKMKPICNLKYGSLSQMTSIFQIKDGPTILGAWGKDVGTMVRKLKIMVAYPNGDCSPILEFSPSKLSNSKALNSLADLDGVDLKNIQEIYDATLANWNTMKVQVDGSGKCSLGYAYQALCKYVEQYEEPGKVFIRGDYGNILAAHLQTVLDKLELGYPRLELEKNFLALQLIRVNHGTGHPYSYKINAFGENAWYFSVRLPSADGAREEVVA